MKYQGSKTKLAKKISEIVLQETGDVYVEPFLGGAATFAAIAPHFSKAVGVEILEDIALMWQDAIAGWVPPTSLTREEYNELKYAEPSALRGFAGSACSFAGKWFGGYAADNKTGRNFAAEGSRSVSKRSKILKDSVVLHGDYRVVSDIVGDGVVVYADPPYANTTKYAGRESFDSTTFWKVMEDWHNRGAAVYVSEYNAPPHWQEVAAFERHSSTALNNSGARAVDRVFKL